jgi:hypothetical protein
MCHEPDYVETVVQHPRFPLIDLMLSGHSHGGQIRLPILGPLILPPMGQKYVEGMFHFDHMQLYVNRGIGTVGLPFRLNCPAELTHFTLVQGLQIPIQIPTQSHTPYRALATGFFFPGSATAPFGATPLFASIQLSSRLLRNRHRFPSLNAGTNPSDA